MPWAPVEDSGEPVENLDRKGGAMYDCDCDII